MNPPPTVLNEQALVLRVRNNLSSILNRALKRGFEIAVITLALPFLIPFFSVMALLIKATSPGPVFYASPRIGYQGRVFYAFKFRTMVADADAVLRKMLEQDEDLRREWEGRFKLRNDPRITKIGAFLRKTSLDELPQLLNVLTGEMSLVGPRPILLDEEAERRRLEQSVNNAYFQVRPGMTGLWQVTGRSDIAYEDRVRMDAWYVRNWSLWLDITLLLRTAAVVLGRKGAY